jgi:hypothetical protein
MEERSMVDLKTFKEHVGSHVDFPATKMKILESCREGEFADDVIQAAESRLQDKTYQSAGEALKDLQMS